MPHLIDVENTFWNLICFSKNNAISLKPYIVADYRLLFKHFLCLDIWRLISDHPGWSKLWSIADINLLAFLNCHFSTESYWVNCEPSIDPTNYRYWKSIFLLLLRWRVSWQRCNRFIRHAIEGRYSHIVRSAILVKFVSVNRGRALFCVSSMWNWCRCLLVDIESSNWRNVWLEKNFSACIKFVLVLCYIIMSFANSKARRILKRRFFF